VTLCGEGGKVRRNWNWLEAPTNRPTESQDHEGIKAGDLHSSQFGEQFGEKLQQEIANVKEVH
jgi:hypothetical protein